MTEAEFRLAIEQEQQRSIRVGIVAGLCLLVMVIIAVSSNTIVDTLVREVPALTENDVELKKLDHTYRMKQLALEELKIKIDRERPVIFKDKEE